MKIPISGSDGFLFFPKFSPWIFQKAAPGGVAANLHVYSALVSALGASRRWRDALHLYAMALQTGEDEALHGAAPRGLQFWPLKVLQQQLWWWALQFFIYSIYIYKGRHTWNHPTNHTQPVSITRLLLDGMLAWLGHRPSPPSTAQGCSPRQRRHNGSTLCISCCSAGGRPLRQRSRAWRHWIGLWICLFVDLLVQELLLGEISGSDGTCFTWDGFRWKRICALLNLDLPLWIYVASIPVADTSLPGTRGQWWPRFCVPWAAQHSGYEHWMSFDSSGVRVRPGWSHCCLGRFCSWWSDCSSELLLPKRMISFWNMIEYEMTKSWPNLLLLYPSFEP